MDSLGVDGTGCDVTPVGFRCGFVTDCLGVSGVNSGVSDGRIQGLTAAVV